MATSKKFEFDCPQYVDFENVDNDSQVELFFERVHDHSPRLSAYSRFEDVKPKLSSGKFLGAQKEEKPEVSEFPVFDGPFRNTRLAQEKSQNINDQQRYPLRETASRTLSNSSVTKNSELPSKKAKLELSENIFKQPLARKQKNYASHTEISSRRKELSRRSNLENRLPTTSKATGADSSMSRTVPVPFSFQTDKRLKSGTTISVEYKPLDFIASLRSNRAAANAQAKIPSGPVRAVSERLLRKRKFEPDCKTLAEKVMSFEQGLSNRTKSNSTPDGKKGNRSLHVTQPVTPHFRAAARSRPTNILSHEQKEDLEAEEIKKYQFKARPMDPRIFVPFGLKVRQTGNTPKVVPMSLETERRALLKSRSRSLDREVAEPKPEFHARPMPRKIFQAITGLGKRVVPKPTEAHTPPFMLKEREESWKQLQTKQKEAEEEAAAKAAVQFKKPRRTRSHDSLLPVAGAKEPPKRTLPAPFSFHVRDQSMLAKKEDKIKQIIEEEKKLHEFQAHPMPSPSVSGIPQRITAPVTVIESFSIDQKGLDKAAKWQKNMEEEMQLQKKLIMFKAQPCTVTIKEPFKLAKSSKPPTEIAEFSLHTESRLADRVKYDEHLLQKEKEKQEILEHRRLEEEALAQKEIAEMRAKAVHKANPMPEYRPFEVKKQLIPVTKPVTPKFETDQRLRARKDD